MKYNLRIFGIFTTDSVTIGAKLLASEVKLDDVQEVMVNGKSIAVDGVINFETLINDGDDIVTTLKEQAAAAAPAQQATAEEPQAAAPVVEESVHQDESQAAAEEGPSCSECGGKTVRDGSIYKCLQCGHTTDAQSPEPQPETPGAVEQPAGAVDDVEAAQRREAEAEEARLAAATEKPTQQAEGAVETVGSKEEVHLSIMIDTEKKFSDELVRPFWGGQLHVTDEGEPTVVFGVESINISESNTLKFKTLWEIQGEPGNWAPSDANEGADVDLNQPYEIMLADEKHISFKVGTTSCDLYSSTYEGPEIVDPTTIEGLELPQVQVQTPAEAAPETPGAAAEETVQIEVTIPFALNGGNLEDVKIPSHATVLKVLDKKGVDKKNIVEIKVNGNLAGIEDELGGGDCVEVTTRPAEAGGEVAAEQQSGATEEQTPEPAEASANVKEKKFVFHTDGDGGAEVPFEQGQSVLEALTDDGQIDTSNLNQTVRLGSPEGEEIGIDVAVPDEGAEIYATTKTA